ncbi:MAG: hypothetical protein ABIH90_02875 [Candidatus Aenigmatarchaeota archaeon]
MMDFPTGETTTITRPGYRIEYIRPCGERGKLIAEGRIEISMPLPAMKGALEKKYRHVVAFPKMDMLKFDRGDHSILLYGNGDLVIRKIKNVGEALETAENIVSLLKQS